MKDWTNFELVDAYQHWQLMAEQLRRRYAGAEAQLSKILGEMLDRGLIPPIPSQLPKDHP